MLSNVRFAAVLGGIVDATNAPSYLQTMGSRGYQAISIVGGSHNVVRGVRALANNTDAAITIKSSQFSEVSNCDIGGTAESPIFGRCLWTLNATRALIHDNKVHHCTNHALDLDVKTTKSAVWNNICEDNTQEGIYIEQNATDNYIFNNTVFRNKYGISVYSNQTGPVSGNYIVRNTVASNQIGISSGGTAKGTNSAKSNAFVDNVAINNQFDYDPNNGVTEGDYWTGNTVAGTGQEFESIPALNADTAIFKPEKTQFVALFPAEETPQSLIQS